MNSLMSKLDIATAILFLSNIFLMVHFNANEFNTPIIKPIKIKKILCIKTIIIKIYRHFKTLLANSQDKILLLTN